MTQGESEKALADIALGQMQQRDARIAELEAELARVRAECDRRGRVIEAATARDENGDPCCPFCGADRCGNDPCSPTCPAFTADGTVRWGEP